MRCVTLKTVPSGFLPDKEGPMLKRTPLPDFLISPRVLLRRHETDFAALMYAAVDQDRARLGVFLPWVEQTKKLEDTIGYIKMAREKWDSGELFDYSMFLEKGGAYVGNIGIHTISWDHRRCEVGYWILGAYEGQGLMAEALRALERALFAVGFNRVEIHCSSANARSAGVPRRGGYRLEGQLRQDRIESNGYTDTLIFGKLSSEAHGGPKV